MASDVGRVGVASSVTVLEDRYLKAGLGVSTAEEELVRFAPKRKLSTYSKRPISRSLPLP